jgi:hypothetical protein
MLVTSRTERKRKAVPVLPGRRFTNAAVKSVRGDAGVPPGAIEGRIDYLEYYR